MKLYCNAQSRSNTILPLLKELDIEDQVELIELEYGTTMRSAEYLALNPLGKVPCLVDGDAVISETPAIFAYLADKYAEKGFANEPGRCPTCRAARKQRAGGDAGRQREMHDVVCASCGVNTQVPFRPSSDRPVYCRDCFTKNR